MSYFQSFIERMRAFGVKPVNRRKITAQQMYPWAIERQLQDELQTEFRNAGDFYMKEALRGTSSFHDSMDDLDNSTYNNDDVLKPLAARISRQVEVFQQETFANFTDTVIGARYIPSAVSTEISETWQKNFVTTCKSVEDNLKSRVSQIVNDAVMNGNNISDTAKQIREAVGKMSKSKALTIARTETAKLNMAISKAQMQECGIEYYEWSCMMDERSRASHVKMDGRICIWNDPTKYYDLNSHRLRDRPQSAVHLHPGDDVNCRCIALPWDPLIEEELNKKKGKPNDAWLKMQEEQKQKEAEKRAQREEDKRNRELVPKLQKQVSDIEKQLLDEQLENKGLEDTFNLYANSNVVNMMEQVIHVHSDSGTVAYIVTANSRQDAKYALYLDIKNHPEKYGPNAYIPKFSPDKFKGPAPEATIRNASDNPAKTTTANKTTETTKKEKSTVVNSSITWQAKSVSSNTVSNTTESSSIKSAMHISDDIKSLSEKIKNQDISLDELNEKLFGGKKYIRKMSILENLPDDVREVFLQGLNDVNITDITSTGKLSHQHDKGISINLSDVISKPSTLFHETAHWLDSKKRKRLYFSISGIGESVKEEFVEPLMKKCNYDKKKIKREIEELAEYYRKEVDGSDFNCIHSSLTDWVGLSGHEDIAHAHAIDYRSGIKDYAKNYGYTDNDAEYAALSLEGFAEITEMLCYKGTKNFLKKYLPNTLKKYYNIIGVNP